MFCRFLVNLRILYCNLILIFVDFNTWIWIRIKEAKIMQIHADPDPDPQHWHKSSSCPTSINYLEGLVGALSSLDLVLVSVNKHY